ncbi:MAG: alpha/beta fold hydrolase [Oculatellaceae cyanobacterium Prado106]|jgi:homoserine O-acetyltransferase|nr:alpha/beta fold hydrolase [Oculatellaceae cyanobacterium Prado106]
MADSFKLNHFTLHCGATLDEVQIVYQTYGALNGDRTNAILYPTSYGAQHSDIDWLIGENRILDPTKWFVIIPNMLGNGLSTSPSNSAYGADIRFSHYDNVRIQKQLLEEVFQIEQLALIYGWSMGAQQAYHWGALYPDRVQRIAALCGTARTTDHNRIFLQSLRSALTADPAWTGTRFESTPDRGFRAFAEIYASWAASQAFYREKIYQSLGYASLEDYLARFWEASYRRRDPHNLLSMIATWIHCDVSDNPTFQGNYPAALQAIRAKTYVMPATTDLYFTPEDCAAEAELIPHAEYHPIRSIWGHRAGNPYENPADEAFIRSQISNLLNTQP